jgi:hypothetical protein
VSVHSSRPLLLLENFESSVESITCNPSTIELRFIDKYPVDTIEAVWDELVSGYAITSHAGCNDEGARVLFL